MKKRRGGLDRGGTGTGAGALSHGDGVSGHTGRLRPTGERGGRCSYWLLVDRLVTLRVVEAISDEAVGTTLKKGTRSRG